MPIFRSREDRVRKLEESVAKEAPKALSALYARRFWVVGQLARDRISFTGGALQHDVDKHAQALFFIDYAIDSVEQDQAGSDSS